ncbi:MAG: hypothetical protein CBB68_00980 [Rhodospirillaceae bacterium TMED8]|nr:DNA polymerase III subunit gamma/tau [Magnetovibrio sp.]OUT53254.1 MAG: hypothetical protein CBB68_00980 [Rhodospirillaceae bacterium TMED8]|tara:strand:+ start:3869 stop:5608 length:1740 start_codon:yes stop_codon:yes gene_type:complete
MSDFDNAPYQVLARKFRPTTLSGLIGQDVLVKTMINAFKTRRLAHAFILTGVRGVGKTTAARIIARALNCIGTTGDGEPTTEPCGQCEHCIAIGEDRHVDVFEMDAASRTGVEDIRELIDGVRYRPTAARNKVYIIDEVHMLSKNAFNALLKTLEEPPEHVKFIFATTEIRKVPVTVLSRCQRFDLQRVGMKTLEEHFTEIAEKEGVLLTPTAVNLIARAADGSVRDGLSILDQAISHTQGKVDDVQVRDMLGLADRTSSFQLFEFLMAGDAIGALQAFETMFIDGADPESILEDLLEVVHWITRAKIIPSLMEDPTVPELERSWAQSLEARLAMPELSRAWQVILKGLNEVRTAPSTRQAADMVLVRVAYTATLPTPDEALKALDDNKPSEPISHPVSPAPRMDSGQSPSPPPTPTKGPLVKDRGGSVDEISSLDVPATVVSDSKSEDGVSNIEQRSSRTVQSFDEVVALADELREGILRTHLINNVHLVSFAPGCIELRQTEAAPAGLAGQLGDFLSTNTGEKWVVSMTKADGDRTMAEQQAIRHRILEDEAAGHPMVKQVLDTFPGTEIKTVKPQK